MWPECSQIGAHEGVQPLHMASGTRVGVSLQKNVCNFKLRCKGSAFPAYMQGYIKNRKSFWAVSYYFSDKILIIVYLGYANLLIVISHVYANGRAAGFGLDDVLRPVL